MSETATRPIDPELAQQSFEFEAVEATGYTSYDAPDTIAFGPDAPRGVIVVGKAQAGKSTFADLLVEVWPKFCDETHPLKFSNSNGHRGASVEILKWAKWPADQSVPEEAFPDILGEYVSSPHIDLLPEIIPGYYSNPPGSEILRSPAVNSVVAKTSEHLVIRPIINGVGISVLSEQIKYPHRFGLPARPGLVGLDARSKEECEEKFARAGVNHIATFILTCPEEIAASRKLGGGASPADVAALAEELRERNATDRNRMLAPMTLPEDVAHCFTVDLTHHTDVQIYEAGIMSVSEHDSAIHIRTDQMTKNQERHALELLFAGMLSEE